MYEVGCFYIMKFIYPNNESVKLQANGIKIVQLTKLKKWKPAQ